MMSDLHGNPRAVEAVIGDAERHGVTQWLVLGDVVAMGPDPAGVLDILDDVNVLTSIAGNTERYVLTGDRPDPSLAAVESDSSLLPRLVEVAASFAWTKGFLAASKLLPTIQRYVGASQLTLPDGTSLLAVHASLAADDGVGIAPHVDDHVLAALFAGCEDELVVGGHTHVATDRSSGSHRFLNPGSVSNPQGSDKSARYLVLHCSMTGHEAEHRSVSYDVDAVRQEIERSGIPGAEFLLRQYFT